MSKPVEGTLLHPDQRRYYKLKSCEHYQLVIKQDSNYNLQMQYSFCMIQFLFLIKFTCRKGDLPIIKMEILDGFSIRRRTPSPSNGHNFQTFFYPTFFLLQLNTTYMKQILHLVPMKNIVFKSSFNRFKIDIHQQLRPLTANYLAMFKVTSTTIYT